MTIKEIVKEWLTKNEYDGLCCLEWEENCGCGIDDLMSCDGFDKDFCLPAYKHETDDDIFYALYKEREPADIISKAAEETQTALKTLADTNKISLSRPTRERIEKIKQSLEEAATDLVELTIKLVQANVLDRWEKTIQINKREQNERHIV
ncbi:MAG: hypothetical protein LBQ52_04865 [Helicobacteraceae bacterium]|jgi:hypothetical protein|nr:hypothetical protein [Helicobacteraceae bacterium]